MILKTIPEKIFEDFLDEDYDMVCIKHSYRDTVLDEYEEVLRLQYDYQYIILEQLNAYSLIYPEIFLQKPFWTGILVRKHNNIILRDAMEDWLAQVMRYSRRDQLSFNYIIQKYKLKINKLDLDNASTNYYQWPSSVTHVQPSIKLGSFISIDKNMRAKVLEKNLAISSDKLKDCEKAMQILIKKLHQVEFEYEQSTSWRITRPLRRLKMFFRGDKDV